MTSHNFIERNCGSDAEHYGDNIVPILIKSEPTETDKQDSVLLRPDESPPKA